ncbi:MAG: glycerate kinase [Cyanobacteriota bacterium]|nr:glycerate kinase [Cyanobacteriota bacterium]
MTPVPQTLVPILADWLGTGRIAATAWSTLIQAELADPRRAQAWGIGPDNVVEQVQIRLRWLRSLAQLHPGLPLPAAPLSTYLPLAWHLWLPLALHLKQIRDRQPHPLIQGILAGQGTGKTTLAAILSQLLRAQGYGAATLSLDDLYQPWGVRRQLQRADPRLRWRGPPGTHDIPLGLATLAQVRQATPGRVINLPRFDKSLHHGEGDRTDPEPVQAIDILLFEGWFVGLRPLPPEALETGLAALGEGLTPEADRQFARDINQALAAYLPLWQSLDRLLLILPQDYRWSQGWRQQAEQALQAQGKTGMDQATVADFVAYFWRALPPPLFIPTLIQPGGGVDLVIEVDVERRPQAIYQPGD